jgi:hypothetical protein
MGIVDPSQSNLDTELNDLDTSIEVDAKYKGKSVEDLIRMHEEAERKASRLGNEVGQLRTALQTRPTEEKEPAKKEVKVDDLLDNPEEAVNTLVNQNPVVKKINSAVDQLELSLHQKNFEAKHPDFRDDIQDEQFLEWVNKNPVRRSLAAAADKLDFQAAEALWDMYSEHKDIVKEVKDAAKAGKDAKRKADLKKGTLESGNGQPTESTKIWSRAEIRSLKERALLGDRKAVATVSDPKWQAEVMAAYAEGRAK